ncbi:unnamed protein product [Mesocestoides corti]|uniref:Tyrosine specific protein phosphatases domain-containing protein n=1 Tax=Mesocestoides corti TaxID=53468 RepID=A0A0R3U5N9_MESCO|nr:unnamed protein product [Mesocestoides corti]
MVSRQLLKPVITDVIYKGMHFVIMDSPTADTAQNFAKHWEFDDGSLPPDDILEKWFELLRLRFYGPKRTPAGDGNGDDNSLPGPVAVHCLAGYGRAPVLVAVALLELGMTNQNAIELIRSKRKGAFNDRQVDYLRNYRAHGRLRRDQHHCPHLRPLTPLTLGLPPHPRPVPLSPPPPLPFLSDISTTGFASDLVRTDNKLLYNRFCGGTGGYGHRGDDDDDNVLISFSRSTAYVVVSFLFLLLLSPLHSGLFVSLPL